MDNDFIDWWRSGGSEKWSKALDAEGGTLKALEMVFDFGKKAGRDELYRLQANIDKRDNYI